MTRSWVGGVNSNFSEPNNWSPAAVPTAADSLVFPSGTITLNDDLPAGTSFGPMTFNGNTTLNGNAMTLTGNVTFNNYPTFICNVDLKIGAPLALGQSNTNTAQYNGVIDVNGQTVTIGGSGAMLKSLNGSGTVVFQSDMVITGDGSFSGTITGFLDVEGSIPNADLVHQGASFVWGALSGTGALGNVETSQIRPGYQSVAYLEGHTFGTLTTKSLTLGGHAYDSSSVPLASFDLNPAGGSDEVDVHGTVTLTDARLEVSFPAGVPAAGQQFIIINNDGTDAVNGTFDGLPEGAVFDVTGVDFRISYRGGDGNDVVLTVPLGQKRWTGAASSLWSNPANWSPAAVPVSGEPLLFPSAATMTNDLPAGTVFGPLTFNADATLNGNAMTLTGDVTFNNYPTFICNVDLKIGAPLVLGQTNTNTTQYNGAIDVNGQNVTIGTSGATLKSLNGSGTVFVEGGLTVTGDGTFSGTISVTEMNVDGSMPNADVVRRPTSYWGAVSGTGTLGNVETSQLWPGYKSLSSGDVHAFGTLTMKSLTLGGTAYDSSPVALASFDLNPAGGSDEIDVHGTVTLNGARLAVTVPSGVPVFGQHFVIINNDGSDPVAGTFDGLPEGAALTVNGYQFRITYAGGDGNDVELIAASQPSLTASQNIATSVTGESVTFNATVSSPFGQPAGTITFTDNGNPIGGASLVNGTASFSAPLTAIGDHPIAAVYSGAGAFLGATSSPFTHTVTRGETSTGFGSLPVAVFGRTQIRTLTTPKVPAAGVVSGTVTLSEGGNPVGSATLSGSEATFDAPMLEPGTHTLVATYGGSSSFLGSASEPFQVAVDPALVQLSVSANGSQLTIDVDSVDGLAEIPTGMVMITERGSIVTQQPITGSANVNVTLGPGHHALQVSYSGDEFYQGASKEVDVDVTGASPPSRRRGVRH